MVTYEERAKEISEEHWEWFKGWAQRLEMPKNKEELVDMIGHAYKDAMEHGFKHGIEHCNSGE